MDVGSVNYLYFLMVTLAAKFTRTAGDCKVGSKVTHRPYSQTIVNQTIVGPVMSSITAINERECEMECHVAVPDLCHMFNYYPSSKVCELLYKDRAAEYKVKKKKGSTFKTRKCPSNPCSQLERCYSLGVQSKNHCFYSGSAIKANTAPVCIGTKDDSYGTFFAPADGEIKTVKLVHISGGVSGVEDINLQGNWGTLIYSGSPSHIELHVTDNQDVIITPPSGYPVSAIHGRLRYDVPGFTNMSPELVFPEISPPLAVTKGKELRIWFGQDLTNFGESNNYGTTCADVFVYYANKP